MRHRDGAGQAKRLASALGGDRRRQWCMWAAALLFGAIVLTLGLALGGGTAEAPTMKTRLLALDGVDDFGPDEAALLRAGLLSSKGDDRRLALWHLGRTGAFIQTPLLEAMLMAPAEDETIDAPVSTAGPSSAGIARQKFKAMTIRAVLMMMWRQAQAHGAHPTPDRIEPLLRDGDEEVRLSVVRILGENDSYAPSGSVLARIRADTPRVVAAAAPLLGR